jgi:hypothetical protein
VAGKTDLVRRTLDEEREITERARLKAERKSLRVATKMAELRTLVSSVKLDSARIVNLRRHMFKDDEDLDKLGLTKQQKRVVRQFEEPKKSTAFGVESAAKLIEAETRAQAEKASVKINVENATIVLPEKKEETIAPVFIDVAVED